MVCISTIVGILLEGCYIIEGKHIEREDIEDILLEVMSNEFCTLLEDGSEVEVAKAIWILFQESIKGKTNLLESLRQRASRPLNIPVKSKVDDSSSSGTEEDCDIVMDDNE